MTDKKNPFFGLKFDNALKRVSKVTQQDLSKAFDESVEEEIRDIKKRAKETRKKIAEGVRKAGGNLPL